MKPAQLQRQDLLNRFAAYNALNQQATAARTALEQLAAAARRRSGPKEAGRICFKSGRCQRWHKRRC